MTTPQLQALAPKQVYCTSREALVAIGEELGYGEEQVIEHMESSGFHPFNKEPLIVLNRHTADTFNGSDIMKHIYQTMFSLVPDDVKQIHLLDNSYN